MIINKNISVTLFIKNIKMSNTHLPRRKYALLICYCGTGYQGMQMYILFIK